MFNIKWTVRETALPVSLRGRASARGCGCGWCRLSEVSTRIIGSHQIIKRRCQEERVERRVGGGRRISKGMKLGLIHGIIILITSFWIWTRGWSTWGDTCNYVAYRAHRWQETEQDGLRRHRLTTHGHLPYTDSPPRCSTIGAQKFNTFQNGESFSRSYIFQLPKKLPTFYGTTSFVAEFTTTRHLSLSLAGSNRSTPTDSISRKATLTLILLKNGELLIIPANGRWDLIQRLKG